MVVTESPMPSFGEYPAWLRENHKVTVDDRLRNRYETVARSILLEFSASEFWVACQQQIGEFDAEYVVLHGYQLTDRRVGPELLVKPFGSFLLKTYRKNISENVAWPDPPLKTGWIVPLEGLSKINDVIRTLFVVKYLDGVEFLVERLEALALEGGFAFRSDLEAKEEGYYAAHAYVSRVFEVPAEKWDTEKLEATIELQVTTQVQELIRRLLHRYYEERRSRRQPSDAKWQWNYKSEEFGANYLGHILHYVEGMIMDIRDKQGEKGK